MAPTYSSPTIRPAAIGPGPPGLPGGVDAGPTRVDDCSAAMNAHGSDARAPDHAAAGATERDGPQFGVRAIARWTARPGQPTVDQQPRISEATTTPTAESVALSDW